MRLIVRAVVAPLVAALVSAAATRTADAQRTAPRPAVRPPAADSLLTVVGSVYDSVAGEPLGGATIQFAAPSASGRLWIATTGADGAFRIDSVPRGDYVVAFVHPSLDVMGIESPMLAVHVDRGMSPVALGLPAPGRLFGALCPRSAPADSLAAIAGRVHDAEADVGLAAKVVVTWTDYQLGVGRFDKVRHRIPVTTRPDGSYLVCNLPGNTALVVGAESPARIGGLLEVTLPAGTIVRRDFALADSVAAVVVTLPVVDGKPGETGERVLRGSARVTGIVRTSNGQPVLGARVTVEGTGLVSTTGEDGTFSLGGLPAGTFSLVARAVGYEPRGVPVDLSSKRVATARVVLDARVQTLATVKVTEKRSRRSRDMDAFEQRRAQGWGHYITSEDVERTHPTSLSNLLMSQPGLHVSPLGGNAYAIRGRGNCRPNVVIDGLPISDAADNIDDFVRPDAVAGIEVYSGEAGAPAEYGSNGCGTVLIWTKR